MCDIDLYTGWTMDGRKVSILLEEIGVEYKAIIIDTSKGEQNSPEFVAINPRRQIPAIVDRNPPDGKPLTVFESGAIMLYIAEKYGKFLPQETRAKYKVMEWLMLQSSSFSNAVSQHTHFNRGAKEKIPYAINRFLEMTLRIYRTMDDTLAKSEYLAGNYSVADISCFTSVYMNGWQGIDLNEFPHVKRWYELVGARPKVIAGNAIPPNRG